MSEQAFSLFQRSMNIGYDEWRDGTGYNLGALDELTDEELRAAEDLLIARDLADWRDIEALDAIGSPRSLEEVRRALQATSLDVRIAAVEHLVRRGLLGDPEVEAITLAALDTTTISNAMVRILAFARAHPTEAIRRKLLALALDGNDDIRVHAAAMAHHLYGCTGSEFDSEFSDFYLRFAAKDRGLRHAAYCTLCSMVGVG